MAYTTSEMLEALITKIQAIDLTSHTTARKAHGGDRFRGQIAFEPPGTGVDRAFALIPASSSVRANRISDRGEHRIQVEILIEYARAEGAVARVVDDGELITEALEDFRYDDGNITELTIELGAPVIEGEEDGTLEASRIIEVVWLRA